MKSQVHQQTSQSLKAPQSHLCYAQSGCCQQVASIAVGFPGVLQNRPGIWCILFFLPYGPCTVQGTVYVQCCVFHHHGLLCLCLNIIHMESCSTQFTVSDFFCSTCFWDSFSCYVYQLCYATELGSVPRLAAKPIWRTPGCGDGFQGGVLKATFKGEGCKRYDFLLTGWWRGNRVMFGNLNRPTSLFQPVWGLCACGQHMITILYLGRGLTFCINSKMCIRMLCIFLKEELDSIIWLNYCF